MSVEERSFERQLFDLLVAHLKNLGIGQQLILDRIAQLRDELNFLNSDKPIKRASRKNPSVKRKSVMEFASYKALRQASNLAGNDVALAKAIGVKGSSLSAWFDKGFAPPMRCPRIEDVTGVRVEELRPDLTWHRNNEGLPVGYSVPVGDGK